MADQDDLSRLVDSMLASYRSDARGRQIGKKFMPSRGEILAYFGRQDLEENAVEAHLHELLGTLRDKLTTQIELCLCFCDESAGRSTRACLEHAREQAARLLARLPEIRATLIADVQAAYDGDPAADSLDEVILAYPGLLAVTVHRVAHELYAMGVPLMPRIMSEWAHAQTGADIHPGASIGPSFFIDHATGVVVGETTSIGRGVKLYQGVTLGALSVPRDERGRVIRGTKRHPTVEDGVTVYANTTVLGGSTVVSRDSVLGGSVFLTKSVPAGSRVAVKPPELSLRSHGEWVLDFEI